MVEGVSRGWQRSGLDQVDPGRRIRLLFDNGPSYVANDLAECLESQGMRHTGGKPYHPRTQGKIELWHLSLKICVLLESDFLPGVIEGGVTDFVYPYNHRCYHESLDNLTPADAYLRRGACILERRREIKRRTFEPRRSTALQRRSMSFNQMSRTLSEFRRSTDPKILTTVRRQSRTYRWVCCLKHSHNALKE